MQRHELSTFKDRLRLAREQDGLAWDRSRHLVRAHVLPETVQRLSAAIRAASLPPALTEALLSCLPDAPVAHVHELAADRLKQLTGLPATKAVRALCVLFGLAKTAVEPAVSAMPSTAIDAFLRGNRNPYDLLLEAEVASLLDLGAGDLSFEEELLDQYQPRLLEQGRRLVVHAVDRLESGSALGGPLHPPQSRLDKLTARESNQVEFRFWGNQDMFTLHKNPAIWPLYTIVTCHAPATPTFAFEPTRLSARVIAEHLRKTKGVSRTVRVGGETALEVQHEGKALLFPPWKFEIRGPLALLDLVPRRGQLVVLTSIDTEVFWELLAQLIADPGVRPPDTILTSPVVPEVFGGVHRTLSSLRVGERASLSDLTELRSDLPRILPGRPSETYAFHAVHIRRGATFPGMPASLTARRFKDLKHETVPWCVILMP